MALAFDTHKYVKRLTNAGMPEPQAEVIADEQRSLIEDQLATKRDLKELEQRLIIRLGGMMIAGFGVIAALIRFLPTAAP